MQKENNLFLSSSDTNPFTGSLSNGVASAPNAPDTSEDHFVDLLSGDYSFSEPISQPVRAHTTHEAGDILDFLDQAIIEHNAAEGDQKSFSEYNKSSEQGNQQYIRCLKSLAGADLVCLHDSSMLIACIWYMYSFWIHLTFPNGFY